jgi:putative FmdB family regulatory protein
MPIYEFKCKKCGNIFETLFFSLQEKRQVSCPDCQSKRTARVMSIFGGKSGGASSALADATAGSSSCSASSCSPG